METDVQGAKAAYNEALQNLEKISDEIHKLREDQKLNDYHDEVSLTCVRVFQMKIICGKVTGDNTS